jgi:sortase A
MTGSNLLVVAGLALSAVGVRDLTVARASQVRAAASWNNEAIAPEREARPGDVIARVVVARVGIDVFVFEGTRPQDLARGPGRLTATARPGRAGNCVIAGHRDTHFRGLRKVRAGDIVEVHAGGATFRYRVERMRVVDPEETGFVRATPHARLTLVTCYPFHFVGSAPQRYVVEAEMEGANPASRQSY